VERNDILLNRDCLGTSTSRNPLGLDKPLQRSLTFAIINHVSVIKIITDFF